MIRWMRSSKSLIGLGLALPAAACSGAYHTPSDGRLTTRIDTAYAGRDACLTRNAAEDATLSLATQAAARAVALACVPETEKLVEVVNRDGDPQVAEAVRRDSEFRALSFVLRARGQVSN